MKKQILNEEYRRMQRLAGIITESEFINESEEQQAVSTALKYADKLENSPKMDALAKKVAGNPKLMAELEKALKMANIQVNEVSLEDADVKQVAMAFAKKAANVKEDISSNPELDDTSAGLYMASFLGGGMLAGMMGKTILAVAPALGTVIAGPAVAGAVAGVALFYLAKKVYLEATGK